MSRLSRALRHASTELDRLGVPWALLGGLAVSVRTEPRFTRDIDLAVAVSDDAAAEQLVRALMGRSYRLLTSIEQLEAGRLATVRFQAPGEPDGGVVVDLLFASSGIEPEVVDGAEKIEVLPGFTCPVALAGDLLALKLLARNDETRPQDAADIRALCSGLTPEQQSRARQAVRLIVARGFHRERELESLLEQAVELSGPGAPDVSETV